MCTGSIFLHPNFAVWTLSHVSVIKEETFNDPVFLGTTSLVPWLLTNKTSVGGATGTGQPRLITLLHQSFIAKRRRTPNHFWVVVYLFG
jgi:hypothetical protein